MIRLLPFTRPDAPVLRALAGVHDGGAHDAGEAATRLSFGVEAIDARIGGGLLRRALHEVYAADGTDAATAAGFALMIAMLGNVGRAHADSVRAPLIWIREHRCARNNGHLHAAGLVELGFDPDDLVLVEAPDALGVLRAGADSVKCGQVGAVVIEPWGKAPLLDLTASRRLSMAAAASGVLTLVLRVEAAPVPSAAQTRWQVAAAPSAPLAAGAPGHPAFDISLLRHRGGMAGFTTRVEWNRDTRTFESILGAPLSGGVSAAASVRTDWAKQAA